MTARGVIVVTSTLFLLMASNLRSFVDTAAIPPSEGMSGNAVQLQDSNVRDLESLKSSLGNTVKIMKIQASVYSDVNGQKEVHSEAQEEVDSNGKLLARVGHHIDTESAKFKETPSTRMQTDIEIPSENVHKSIIQSLPSENKPLQTEKRRVPLSHPVISEGVNTVEKLNPYSKMQYSPLDMAEYVFWTGDEKGVTLAVEEFLEEGLMNREEAITFLQEIKYNLDYLQSHYAQLGLNLQDRIKNKVGNSVKFNGKAKAALERPELSNTFDLSQLRKEATKKTITPLETLAEVTKSEDEALEKRNQRRHNNQDPDYDELLERLRVADFLYTEYSLEEVIYQLAKVMFTQSLTHGNAEAQQALQKFTTFLETEAAQGRISRALEKKVLDVLIASLTDTLSEYPELLSAARESLAVSESYTEKQQLLRKILDLGIEDKATLRAMVGPYLKENKEPALVEFKTNSPKHAGLQFGKYNTS